MIRNFIACALSLGMVASVSVAGPAAASAASTYVFQDVNGYGGGYGGGYSGGGYGGYGNFGGDHNGYGYRHYKPRCYYKKVRVWGNYGYQWSRVRVCE